MTAPGSLLQCFALSETQLPSSGLFSVLPATDPSFPVLSASWPTPSIWTFSLHFPLLTHFLFFFFLACVLVQISDWSSLLLWARPHRCLARHWSSGSLHQLNGHVKDSRVTWKNMATCFIEAVGGEVSHRRTERQGKHSGCYTQGEFHNQNFQWHPHFIHIITLRGMLSWDYLQFVNQKTEFQRQCGL